MLTLRWGRTRLSRSPRPSVTWLIAFFLTFSLLLLRTWPRIQHPEAWAEDGAYFIPYALNFGWAGLLEPYQGYYFFLQRALIQWVTTFTSPHSWPLNLMLSFIAVQAAIYASLTSPHLEWVFPKLWVRFALGILLCLAPGLNEMVGNMANLNWVLYLYIGVIALKDPKRPLSICDLILLVVFSFSVGTAILLFPIYLLRLVVALRGRLSTRVRVTSVFAVLVTVIIPVLLIFTPRAGGPAQTHTPVEMILTYFKTFFDSFLYQPWLGHSFSIGVLTSTRGVRRIIFLVVGLLFLLNRVWRYRRYPALPYLILFVVGTSLWVPLSWIARPGNFWAFELPLSDWYLNHRYSFPIGSVALFFWLFVLEPGVSKKSVVSGLGILFVILNVVLIKPRFWIREQGKELRWKPIAEALESYQATGCPNSIQAPIYPDTFTFSFITANGKVCQLAEKFPLPG